MQLRTILPYLALCCILLPTVAFAQHADDNLSGGGDGSSSPSFTLFNFPIHFKHQDDYNIEFAIIGLSILLIFKMIIGRRTNRNLAILYVAEMDRVDGILKKQFAEAEPTVMVDGPETFKFYATGRRYCQGALFTFRMASRQDLYTSITKFGIGQKDVLEIEVNMNESAMPSTVLFIGTHTAAKTVTKENRDIVELAKRMEPTRDRLATWPGVDGTDNGEPSPLVVHAEHASVFYEVMSPVAMDPFLSLSKYFRYMHASSDYRTPYFSESTSTTTVGAIGKRNVVRFAFTLPPSGNLETLDKIVAFVCLVIDGLGTCKLTPEQVKKAADLRRTVEAKRESTIVEKERKLEERRAAKEAEERARLAKLPPDQREKERAKRDKILKQRKMKSLVKRM